MKGCEIMEEKLRNDIQNRVIVVDTEAETDDNERKKFFERLNRALDRSEDDIRNGRVRDAKVVFKELREKYGIK